jgi:thiosulfate/3-mercaptopyruvate sulfurtransferase
MLATPGTITHAQQPTTNPAHKPGPEIPAPALLQPAELVQMLPGSKKPLVLQVGSHVLYAEAHIPNAEYVGAAGTSAGLEGLRQRVSRVRKDRTLVIYCGCCPWGRCPNIRPAYEQLQTLGFTHVKVLYLAENFGTDWVDKGYPVAKGR